MQVKPGKEKEVDMPKFYIDDRVKVPNDKGHAPIALLGREGTVIVVGIVEEKSGVKEPWRPSYMVQFDGDGTPQQVDEDWLESA